MNTSAAQHRILTVIPAYNAAASLVELIARLKETVVPADIVVIDDGSTDQTAAVAENESVTVISLPSNRGKGGALKAGFQFARDGGYDGVLTIDADLQHRPEEIPDLLANWDGRSIVLGSRDLSLGRVPPHRWLSNRWTSALVSVLTRRVIADSQCGFRLIPLAALEHLDLSADDYDFESELLLKLAHRGTAVQSVSVSTIYDGSRSYIRPPAEVGRFMRQVWRRLWY